MSMNMIQNQDDQREQDLSSKDPISKDHTTISWDYVKVGLPSFLSDKKQTSTSAPICFLSSHPAFPDNLHTSSLQHDV